MEERWDELAAWARANERDAGAFAAIFDHHASRVFRHARALTDSFHDAEDVTAAAFFELWRRRSAVRLVGGSTLPWLLVTTTNLAHNTRRGLRRYRAMLDRMPRGDNPSEPASTFDRDDYSALHPVLRSLNAVDASLLVLTAIDGYSTKEAAGLVGLSEGAARVRLSRAKSRLRAQLATEQVRSL